MEAQKQGILQTQASNFAEAVAGAVDPRTGLYGATISLGTLIGNDHLGPELPLALRYSPLVPRDIGFGMGITLGLSTFDADAQVLYVSTGEQYPVERRTDGSLQLRRQKLKHLRFEVYGGDYRIVHKSGQIEVLSGPDKHGSLKMTERLVCPAGHTLSLEWDWEQDPPRLKTIRDDRGAVLLRIAPDGWTVLPEGGEESYKVELAYLEAQRLGQVTLTAGSQTAPLVWTLHHEPQGRDGMWGERLIGMTLPGGVEERVRYSQGDRGHALPSTRDGEEPVRLPYVERFTQTWQGRTLAQVTYDYDLEGYVGHNFLGGTLQQAEAGGATDDVLESAGAYLYGSAQTQVCEGVQTVVTRLYNKFHLQVLEQVTTGASTVTTSTWYHTAGHDGDPRQDPGSFAQQPPQFQLPRRRLTQWIDESGPNRRFSKVETVRSEFDTAGHPTLHTDPDGTTTVWEYYPAEGEGDACPADPHGFVHYLKRVTVSPPEINGFAVPAQITEYRYHKLAIDASAYTVLKCEERHYSGKQLLRRQTYEQATQARQRGRLQRYQEIHYPEGESGKAYVTTHRFTCEDQDKALLQRHTVTTHDGKALSRSQTRSRFTGRVWEETDAAGLRMQTTYDALGRALTQTTNPDTEYAQGCTTRYTLLSAAQQNEPSNRGAAFLMETRETTERGTRRVRQALNGAGRLAWVELQDMDGKVPEDWYVVGQQFYDSLGRVQRVTTSDWIEGKPVSATQTITYGAWGPVATVADSAAGVQHSRYDPIERVAETWRAERADGGGQRTGAERTYLDLAGRVTRVEHWDAKGQLYRAASVQYDGLGRVRVRTDAQGDETRYDYDAWGRSRQVWLPDGTVIVRNYAPESAEARVAEITVQGKEQQARALGTQAFDGLGRLKTRSEGGRTHTWNYASDAEQSPDWAQGPDGVKHSYVYIRELGGALRHREAGALSQNFTYNPVTGALREASAGKMRLKHEYWDSGRLQTQTIEVAGQSARSQQFTYTLAGQPRTQTLGGPEAGAVTTTLGYDSYGRLAQQDDPDVTTVLDYDALGRVYQWTTHGNPHDDHSLQTTLTFDDFGRERLRVLTERSDKGADSSWRIEQDWYPNDQLKQRMVSRDGTVLREERYTYDRRGRLTEYVCGGTTPPVDEAGNAVVAQHFTYDAHDNVTRCETRFANQQANTATYHFDNPQDPHQLTGVEHTDPAYPSGKFSYDMAGRLKHDPAGRSFDYDAYGRLETATLDGRSGQYGYDALDRLVTQQVGGATTALYYRGAALACTIAGSETVRLTAGAQVRTGGAQAGTWLAGCDGKGSPVVVSDGQTHEEPAYTPYGGRKPAGKEASVVGYNGERVDALMGAYHLGNGYRAYHPGLMRFTCPDSWSPFGAGGLNPYAYCAGDPVNDADPSGHLSWQAILSIVVGVAGLALAAVTAGASIAAAGGVMAAIDAASVTGVAVLGLDAISSTAAVGSGVTEEKNPKASNILGWVSIGTGLAAIGVGVGAGLRMAARAISRSAFSQRIDTLIRIGMSGRGDLGRIRPWYLFDGTEPEWHLPRNLQQTVARTGGYFSNFGATSRPGFVFYLSPKLKVKGWGIFSPKSIYYKMALVSNFVINSRRFVGETVTSFSSPGNAARFLAIVYRGRFDDLGVTDLEFWFDTTAHNEASIDGRATAYIEKKLRNAFPNQTIHFHYGKNLPELESFVDPEVAARLMSGDGNPPPYDDPPPYVEFPAASTSQG